MTRNESGPFADHSMNMQGSASLPIDEDPVAMQKLFDDMRSNVVSDIDAYTGGEFDAHNDSRMAQLLGKTSLGIQEDFAKQMAYEAMHPGELNTFQAAALRHAYNIMEAVEIVNLASRGAQDPTEAWEHGVTVAATARFRRELNRIKATSRAPMIGRVALGIRFNTGQ